MVTQAPDSGNEKSKHAAAYRECWLGPYLGTRVVDDEQIDAALASGLSVRKIENRLLQAEVHIFEGYDAVAWQNGWLAACDAIAWLDTPANFDLNLADGKEIVDERRQTLRRQCYAAALATGTPELDIAAYSDACARCECCRCAMLFADDDSLSCEDIADILRRTQDFTELRAIAKRRQALMTQQMLVPTWTPHGFVSNQQWGGIQ